MTAGPFDEPAPVGATEYGGVAGIVQPSDPVASGAERAGINEVGGHTPTASEELGMQIRAGKHWTQELNAEGVLVWVQDSVDPVTGLEQPLP